MLPVVPADPVVAAPEEPVLPVVPVLPPAPVPEVPELPPVLFRQPAAITAAQVRVPTVIPKRTIGFFKTTPLDALEW